MKRSLRRIFWLSAAFIGSFVAIWIYLNRESLARFPQLLPAFHSKELCTCLYVIGQDRSYCDQLVKQWLPLRRVEVDASQKRVTAIGFSTERSAHWVSERFGCQLEN